MDWGGRNPRRGAIFCASNPLPLTVHAFLHLPFPPQNHRGHSAKPAGRPRQPRHARRPGAPPHRARPHGAGHRGHHRGRHFQHHRQGQSGWRPGGVAAVCVHGRGLRVFGAVLRAVRGHHSGQRLGLHLRLRLVWRAGGLDYWLGADNGIRGGQHRGGHFVVRLLHRTDGRHRGAHPALAHDGHPNRPRRLRGRDEHHAGRPAAGRSHARPTGRLQGLDHRPGAVQRLPPGH